MTYIVSVPVVREGYSGWTEADQEIADWVSENAKGLNNYIGTQRSPTGDLLVMYIFDEENDALMFRLAWG